MHHSLPNEITSYFTNHRRSVVKNLLILAQGILNSRTTNLNLIKEELSTIIGNGQQTLPSSNYKRLIRFFKISSDEQNRLLRSLQQFSLSLLSLKSRSPRYLVLDGTAWSLGKKKFHLLTLSIVHQGISIPICWKELDKKGTSKFEERKLLLDKVCKWFDLRGMILLGDREYIGDQWFKYLISKDLDFVIRLRKGIYKKSADQCRSYRHSPFMTTQKWRYIGLERLAQQKGKRTTGVGKRIWLAGQAYSFVVLANPQKRPQEPLFYFLSSLRDKKQIIQAYSFRWSIECCFKHLKSNGFDLEAVNLKCTQKIELMMAVICFTYTLAIKQGLMSYRKPKKSDFKIYRNGVKTLSVSIFRRGRSLIRARCVQLLDFLEFLTQLIRHHKIPFWVNVQ